MRSERLGEDTPRSKQQSSRYDRSWVRILRAQNPIQIRFVMADEVDAELLVAVKPRPIVRGNSVLWHLSENVPLIFTSRDVPPRFAASQNYQVADFIEITPLASADSREDAMPGERR